jgi:WD40 repeat protein
MIQRNVATGASRRWNDGANNVNSIAFTPDGKTLSDGDDDGHAVVWNVETGARVTTLSEATDVEQVAFSPDGQALASGNLGGAIALDRSLIWTSTFSTLKLRLCSELGASNMTRAQWTAYVPAETYRSTCT